jgi:FAD/FMN-containing dehydrogenase
LYAANGLLIPLSTNSPTGSTFTAFIDLSLMKSIEVDVSARTANAQGGILWRELDCATLSFAGGTDSEVGIGGLMLGGGNGWLMGLYGATCDNVVQ